MKYKTTKEQCQKFIDDRMPIVCTCCGGKLEPIETVDNADNPTYWVGCMKCQKYDRGTSPKIYKMAFEMVDKYILMPYTHLGAKPITDNEYWLHTQTGGAVSIVENIIKLYENERQDSE